MYSLKSILILPRKQKNKKLMMDNTKMISACSILKNQEIFYNSVSKSILIWLRKQKNKKLMMDNTKMINACSISRNQEIIE